MAGTTAPEDAALLRAVELAALGPEPGPNPRVGCVLLAGDGSVLAEGWHRGAGTPHAEAAAIAAVPPQRRGALRGATAVVSLEPCRHTGRTPPCTEALLGAGVRRLVYGVPDPDPRAGGGAAWLAGHGVDVALAQGPPARAAEDLLRPWLTAVRRGRPWMIGKTACSLDGRVAAADGTSRWITSRESRRHAHGVRARVDAVLVGTGTVLADDPALTAREPDGTLAPHQPMRVVVGERPVPGGARLHGAGGPLLHLRTRDLAAGLDELARRQVRTVLLEGGPVVLTAALRAGLVDELHVYQAPVLLGAGRSCVEDLGVTTLAQAQRWATTAVSTLGTDVHLVLRPPPPNAGGH